MSRDELVDTFAAFPGASRAAAKAAWPSRSTVPDGEWGPNETVRHLIAVEDEVWRTPGAPRQ